MTRWKSWEIVWEMKLLLIDLLHWICQLLFLPPPPVSQLPYRCGWTPPGSAVCPVRHSWGALRHQSVLALSLWKGRMKEVTVRDGGSSPFFSVSLKCLHYFVLLLFHTFYLSTYFFYMFTPSSKILLNANANQFYIQFYLTLYITNTYSNLSHTSSCSVSLNIILSKNSCREGHSLTAMFHNTAVPLTVTTNIM